jgi:hypothetical protein
MEERYSDNRYDGLNKPGSLRVVGGNSSLIFSAPHSVNHRRDGKTKLADRGTGALAEYLADTLGGLALTIDGANLEDPNWDTRIGPFKHRLALLATPGSMIIDLHGMSDSHGMGVCIGLGPSPADLEHRLVDSLTLNLRSYGISYEVNTPFDATPPGTVTRFVQRSGFHALQLELAASYRLPLGRDDQIDGVLLALSESLS